MSTEEDDSTTVIGTPSRLPYVLAGICAAIVLVAVTFLVWLRPPGGEPKASPPACDTAECDRYADLLWRSVNLSRNPCDDFYAYVCAKRNVSVPDELRGETLARLFDRIFSEEVPRSNQTAVQKASRLLRTCLDVVRENRTSVEPLRRLLANASLSWPEFPTSGLLEMAVEVGVNWFLPTHVGIQLDPRRRDERGRPQLLCQDHPYTERWWARGYALRDEGYFLDFVSRHVEVFDPDPRGLSETVQHIMEALSLAEGIAISNPVPGQRVVGLPKSLADVLNARAPWVGSPYDADDSVLVKNRVLYKRIFDQYLREPSEYSRFLDSLRYSVPWSVVERMGRYVSKDLALVQYWGRDARDYDYERDCLELVGEMMGLALAFPEVGGHVPTTTLANGVRALTEKVAAGLLKVLDGSRLPKVESRRVAAIVLSNFREVFFYPPELQPETEVDYLYKGVPDMVHPLFLDNWMDATVGLRNVVAYTSTVLLAFPTLGFEPQYKGDSHALYVPAGATRFPLFSEGLVSAVNYAGLGYGIGKAYAECLLGKESPFAWLDGYAANAYAARRDCIRRKFASVEATTKDVSLRATKAFWSLAPVFEAFRRDTGSPTSRLASAPQFSDEQLFFVALCYNLCSGANSTLASLLCNEPLKNFPPFAEAFGCERGSPMNPVEKCYAW